MKMYMQLNGAGQVAEMGRQEGSTHVISPLRVLNEA